MIHSFFRQSVVKTQPPWSVKLAQSARNIEALCLCWACWRPSSFLRKPKKNPWYWEMRQQWECLHMYDCRTHDLGRLSWWLLTLGSGAKRQGSGLGGSYRTAGSGTCTHQFHCTSLDAWPNSRPLSHWANILLSCSVFLSFLHSYPIIYFNFILYIICFPPL